MRIKKTRTILIGVVLIFICVSCTKIIEIDTYDFPSAPVINCFFTNDSIIEIKLSKTVSPFDSISNSISDANISLYENDIFIETLAFQDDVFISTSTAQSGKKYSIRASIPEFPNITEISSSDILPEPPILTSFTFRDSALIDQEGYPVRQAVISIQDNSDSIQYYEVLLEICYFRNILDTIYEKRIADYCTENYDPVITKEGLIEFKPKTLIFSNELFQAQTYSLKINFQNESYLDCTYPQYREFNLIVHLRKVSESYYKYKRHLVIHQSSITSDFWSGTTEPSTMYTNINGGYGIFAGYTEVLDTVTKNYNYK